MYTVQHPLGGWVFTPVDVKGLKREYKRISALIPEEAKEEYLTRKNRKPSIPEVNA